MKTCKSFLLLSALTLIMNMAVAQFFHPARPLSEPAQIRSWIEREMVYPSDALTNKAQGNVILEFSIDQHGTINSITVAESPHPSLSEEAVRLLKLMQWQPATDGGEAVGSKQTYSFRFNIRQHKRMVRKRGYEKPPLPITEVDTSNKIYTFAALAKAPRPILEPNSLRLNQYIQQELIYPNTALSLGISGNVSLGFVIEANGSVSNIHIINSVGGGCDNEAIRILESIRWEPGIKDGKAVRSGSTLEITFRLPDGSRPQNVPNQSQRTM